MCGKSAAFIEIFGMETTSNSFCRSTNAARSLAGSATPPRAQDQVEDLIHALAMFHLCENGWPSLPERYAY
jgi:hypothetical protein